MPSDPKDLLTNDIRNVTDLWDEPLDEVHDIPPLVNAIIAGSFVAGMHAAVKAEADAVRQVEAELTECRLRHLADKSAIEAADAALSRIEKLCDEAERRERESLARTFDGGSFGVHLDGVEVRAALAGDAE